MNDDVLKLAGNIRREIRAHELNIEALRARYMEVADRILVAEMFARGIPTDPGPETRAGLDCAPEKIETSFPAPVAAPAPSEICTVKVPADSALAELIMPSVEKGGAEKPVAAAAPVNRRAVNYPPPRNDGVQAASEVSPDGAAQNTPASNENGARAGSSGESGDAPMAQPDQLTARIVHSLNLSMASDREHRIDPAGIRKTVEIAGAIRADSLQAAYQALWRLSNKGLVTKLPKGDWQITPKGIEADRWAQRRCAVVAASESISA